MSEKPKSLLHAVAERFKARGLKVPKEISSALKHYDAAPPTAQQRILNAFAVAVPKAGLPQPEWMNVSAWRQQNEPAIAERARGFCPAYPTVAHEVQARLVLGHRPEQILPGLTPAEARKALQEGYDALSTRKTAAAWLLKNTPITLIVPGQVDSVPVARWLATALKDKPKRDALLTERVERGVGGAEVHGRLIDRIDEITPADLPNGPKTSVREAFTHAAARMYKQWEKDNENAEGRLIQPPTWWKSVKYAKLLNTPAKLVREGREMNHCVGTYVNEVRQGRSTIVSFNLKGERATVELSRDGTRVKQCYGAGNKQAPAICQRALDVLMRKSWFTKPNP
jgi:hypothetical protein